MTPYEALKLWHTWMYTSGHEAQTKALAKAIHATHGLLGEVPSKKRDCICQSCGKPFQVLASLKAKGAGKYCSRVCKDKPRGDRTNAP
jgi:hypothetical protein